MSEQVILDEIYSGKLEAYQMTERGTWFITQEDFDEWFGSKKYTPDEITERARTVANNTVNMVEG